VPGKSSAGVVFDRSREKPGLLRGQGRSGTPVSDDQEPPCVRVRRRHDPAHLRSSVTQPAVHTQVRFWSADVAADVRELVARGVAFDTVEFGDLKMVDHVLTVPASASRPGSRIRTATRWRRTSPSDAGPGRPWPSRRETSGRPRLHRLQVFPRAGVQPHCNPGPFAQSRPPCVALGGASRPDVRPARWRAERRSGPAEGMLREAAQ
jgi:hypothetical protein